MSGTPTNQPSSAEYHEPEWFSKEEENNTVISASKTFNLVIKGKQFELTEDEVETLIEELQNVVKRNTKTNLPNFQKIAERLKPAPEEPRRHPFNYPPQFPQPQPILPQDDSWANPFGPIQC